jgi:hypothetical protein
VFTSFLALKDFLFAALGFSWTAAPDLVHVLGGLGLIAALIW